MGGVGKGRVVRGGVRGLWCSHGRGEDGASTRPPKFFRVDLWVGCLLLFGITLTLTTYMDDDDPLRLELATLRQTAARFQASVCRSQHD